MIVIERCEHGATPGGPAATDRERGRITLPGASGSDARHRRRRPVSGHGAALLKALPNRESTYLSSIGPDEAGEPLQTLCTHKARLGRQWILSRLRRLLTPSGHTEEVDQSLYAVVEDDVLVG